MSRMSPRGQWKKSGLCLVISIRGLPLPPSCLLPLGHTAVLRCQAERVFLQIANVNYSPVFWAISSSPPSLILTSSLSLDFCLCLSVCLSVALSPVPSHTPPAFPFPDFTAALGQFSLCASCCGDTTENAQQWCQSWGRSVNENLGWGNIRICWRDVSQWTSHYTEKKKNSLHTRHKGTLHSHICNSCCLWSELKSFVSALQTKSPSHEMNKIVRALNAFLPHSNTIYKCLHFLS